jgi:steroid 5-alpha reductase family enzyme
MPALQALAWAALMLIAIKSVAWWVQRRMGNAGIVDGFWAWGLGGLAVWFALVSPGALQARWAVAWMGGLWGLRLGTYLWRRNWRTAEDFRYADLRERWGPAAQTKLFWFFQFQNLFSLALAASAFMPTAYRNSPPSSAALALAGCIWLLAVAGETLADAQLQAFKRRIAPARRVCNEGLWRHCRHPNYAFECLHWLAYLPLAWGSPWAVATLAAPLVMALLLTRVSGIPLLEAKLAVSLPGYADYMANTPALLPRWPGRHL